VTSAFLDRNVPAFAVCSATLKDWKASLFQRSLETTESNLTKRQDMLRWQHLVLDSCLCLTHRSSHGLTKGVVGNWRQVLDGRVDFEQFTPTRLQTPNCGSTLFEKWKKLRRGGG
jgi:hypothetical protein